MIIRMHYNTSRNACQLRPEGNRDFQTEKPDTGERMRGDAGTRTRMKNWLFQAGKPVCKMTKKSLGFLAGRNVLLCAGFRMCRTHFAYALLLLKRDGIRRVTLKGKEKAESSHAKAERG